MLGEDGKLHADGRIIMKDLFKRSRYFGLNQYIAGNHDMTLVLAERRQFVTHILACIGLSETVISGDPGRAMNLREDVFRDDD